VVIAAVFVAGAVAGFKVSPLIAVVGDAAGAQEALATDGFPDIMVETAPPTSLLRSNGRPARACGDPRGALGPSAAAVRLGRMFGTRLAAKSHCRRQACTNARTGSGDTRQPSASPRRIDDDTVASLTACADSPGQTEQRLAELDHEWDTDRTLEAEAATMGLIGLSLGTFVRKQFLALPAIVAGAVLLQAATGRYPLMPLFRRLGRRTAKEITRERYALKALRGDFAHLGATRAAVSARRRAAHRAAMDRRRTAPRSALEEHAMTLAARLPATTHRVELHTAPELNEAIRRRADAEVVRLEGAPVSEVEQRMKALEP
jgi:hypothetical protein